MAKFKVTYKLYDEFTGTYLKTEVTTIVPAADEAAAGAAARDQLDSYGVTRGAVRCGGSRGVNSFKPVRVERVR